ncbi:MAG: glycosyltransferase family 39 protein [Cyclobacteriaceae bacterium]
MMTSFNSKNYWLVIMAFGLLVFSVFHNLGLVPLYLEEPRRALIALEMIFNDNWWVPTEFGEYYYKKPPFFNWIIILGYKIFGNYQEFSVRFFSIIAYLSTGLVTFFLGRRFVDTTFGIYSAFVYYISADLLFYFTITAGEIDLVYSFVTFSAMAVTIFFYFKKQYLALFVSSYFLTAIGFLTKGIPSLVFQGTTLLALFLFTNNAKKLVSKSHVLGIIVFLIPVAAYVVTYNQWNSFWHYFNTEDSLLTQSTERTLFFNNLTTTLYGVISFPFLLIKILAPGSLLCLFLFKKDAIKRIYHNDFLRICALILLSNIVIYWISPGTRSRYLYMFFPLFSYLFVGLVYKRQLSSKESKIWNLIQNVLLLIFLVLNVYLLFDTRTAVLPNIGWIVFAGILLFLILIFFHKRKIQYRFFIMVIAVICSRLIFNLTVLPVRAETGTKAQSKLDALNIVRFIEDDQVFMYKDSRISRTSIFYLERSIEKVVSFNEQKAKGYHIVRSDYWAEFSNYTRLYEFNYNNDHFAIFKIK